MWGTHDEKLSSVSCESCLIKNGGMKMLAGFLFKEYEMNKEGVVTGYQVIWGD